MLHGVRTSSPSEPVLGSDGQGPEVRDAHPGVWAAPPVSNRPVRVLFIGGQGRSGTTLLDRILGQIPAFFSAGELIHLWAHGLSGERCGCGVPFTDCPFWTKVGSEAFGGWDQLDVPGLVALQQDVDRSRYIPWMVTMWWPPYRRRLKRYTETLRQLYTTIGDVSGGRIVVDSSKHPSLAFLLRRVPDVDVRVVQVVRSSHGVAYSWTKVVQKPEVVDRVELMPRYRPFRSATWWTGYNGLFSLLKRLGVPTTVVQYERLAREPGPELRRVLKLAEQDPTPEDLAFFLSPNEVELGPTHTVSGNPMRFTLGKVTLRLDEEWRKRMSRWNRLVVSAACWPLLHRYGYQLDGTVDERSRPH